MHESDSSDNNAGVVATPRLDGTLPTPSEGTLTTLEEGKRSLGDRVQGPAMTTPTLFVCDDCEEAEGWACFEVIGDPLVQVILGQLIWHQEAYRAHGWTVEETGYSCPHLNEKATEPAAGVMEQLAEEAEGLRWLIAGTTRAMLRSNPRTDRSGLDDLLRSAGIEDLADYEPSRQGYDAATERHPGWEGVGHPDYRPPGWSKTVAECCRDANLLRDLMDPETREQNVARRCEELIALNLVKQIEGRFVPGLPSEERQRLAIERLKESEQGVDKAQVHTRACPACLARIFPDPPDDPMDLLAEGWRTYVQDGRAVVSCPHGDL